MGLIDDLKKLVGVGDDGGTVSTDNFVCGACRSAFQHQHRECPECGSPILVPIEETDLDGDRRQL